MLHLAEEKVDTVAPSVEPHDADIGLLVEEYVQSARADYYEDVQGVASEEWSKAAVGLVTLLILGGIILSQVL